MSDSATARPRAARSDDGILWVGRMMFTPTLRIREVELALRIARRFRLVAVDRADALGAGGRDIVSKLRLRWRFARGGWDLLENGRLPRFRMPVAASTEPVLDRIAARVNERFIREALDRFSCRWVFHSSPFYFQPPAPGRRAYRCHFDVVDNFFDDWPATFLGRWRRGFLRDAIRGADSLTTISLCLCDRVEELTGRRPVYVPNGAALAEIRAWPRARVGAVREHHRFEGRRVLAYIGNHFAAFDGMELLLTAFLAARKVRPDLALLLVGAGSDRLAGALGLGAADGVHVVGPVPADEVWSYFHAADLGVLPFVPLPVTHDALPLKVLEFGAAGKPMLATPLRELERLALPHVRFVPFDAAAWERALLDDATFAPPAEGPLLLALEPFSWDAVTETLLETMGLS